MGFKVNFNEIGPFVGFDTEYVVGHKGCGDARYPLLAATVCVVDMENGTVYEAKVGQKDDDILRYNSEITGLYPGDLEDGEDLKIITHDLHQIFKDRVVCVMDGKNDFKVVNLNINDYEVEDISKNILSAPGQAISLARLVRYYYGIKIQQGVHSASLDAYFTLKLFNDFIKCQKRPIYLDSKALPIKIKHFHCKSSHAV